jgi:hypothetical protein
MNMILFNIQKPILFVCLLLLNNPVFSQINSDSLLKVWNNPTLHDTARLNAIQKLAWDGYLFSAPDSAFYYAKLQYNFALKKNDKKSSIEKEPPTKKRSFQYTKYIGLEYDNVQYRENTMGLRPTESLGFFGIKLFGPDLAISGAVITQMNFKYYGGAPQFYEQATQRPAEGSIIMGDFQFVDVFPSGPLILAHFGFGPMFRYSSYTLQLKDAATSKVTSYGSDSIGVGAIFTLGIGVKAGPVAIRGEVQYIWEELQYFGYSLALQMPFGK